MSAEPIDKTNTNALTQTSIPSSFVAAVSKERAGPPQKPRRVLRVNPRVHRRRPEKLVCFAEHTMHHSGYLTYHPGGGSPR